MKKTIISAFMLVSIISLTGCDQKPEPGKVDCGKAVSSMTEQEKTTCGKAGQYTKSPEKGW